MTCKHCEGKGYSTEYQGDTVMFADFEGEGGIKRKAGIRINLCSCQRGKDLKKYFSFKKKFKK